MRKQYHFWPGDEGLDAWDVHRLIELAHGLPVTRVSIDDIAEIDSVYWFDDEHEPTVRALVAHVRLMDEVDVRHPILLGHDGRVMDGMHCVARALLEGRADLPANRFPHPIEPDFRRCRPDELDYD